MLQSIRDRISGWIAVVVIVLVGGAFVLFGIEYYVDQNAHKQNVVATVNGVSITHQEVNQLLPPSIAGNAELKNYVLQNLITQTALQTTFEKEGFEVALPQIKMMIAQAPEFQVDGTFSQEKLMQAMYEHNLSPLQFFKNVQSKVIIDQVMTGLKQSAFALPTEIKHWYTLKNQERAFGYFIIPVHSFLSNITITDEEIKKEYTANPKEYETPLKVSVAYLELSPTEIAKNINVTPLEEKQYYESHLVNYQVPKRWEVSQITLPLSANAAAADVEKMKQKALQIASEFQDNKNTGYTSTTMMLTPNEMNPSLLKIISHLTPGKVSTPIRTQNGFTVLKMVKVIPSETHSFDSVKNAIHDLLVHQRVNQILTEKSNKLSDLTYTNPDSLDVAAKALGLTIQTSPMITETGGKTGIFSDQKLVSTIFSDSVLDSGNNSNPIALPNGTLVVLRVAKKEPSQLIPLEEVRSKIKNKLLTQRATGVAGLAAYQIQKLLNQGESPDIIAKTRHLEWHIVPLMGENHPSSTVPKAIVEAAFSTPISPKIGNKPMGTLAISFNKDDYSVIAISQVKNAVASNAISDDKSLHQKLSALWGQLLQQSMIESVLNKSHVVMRHEE